METKLLSPKLTNQNTGDKSKKKFKSYLEREQLISSVKAALARFGGNFQYRHSCDLQISLGFQNLSRNTLCFSTPILGSPSHPFPQLGL